MKLNDKRLRENSEWDNFIKERIDKIGLDKLLKELKNGWKKDSIKIIQDSYDVFRKDVRCYKFSGIKKESSGLEIIDTINSNKNNIPIFEIDEDDIEYNIDFPTIPYNKFYISSNSCEIIGNEFYVFGGYFVLHFNTHLIVFYRWSRQIEDGWSFCSFVVRKNGLLDAFNESKSDPGDNEYREMTMIVLKKFSNLMKKLIYKMNKNEYNSYKVYSHGVYKKKNISRDVRGHKRHFWRDSGRFILPDLSKEELLERGYHIAELAIRNGELRRNVPFRLISQFKIGDDIKKNKHTTYDLISKRVWRCEEKIYKILRELFPNNIIRRHDRRTLKGLELDFNLPEFRLGIEYDGEQHYDRRVCEEVFKSDFDAQVRRDRKKDKLCKKKNISLVRIKYNEPLTKTHIKKKLKEFL